MSKKEREKNMKTLLTMILFTNAAMADSITDCYQSIADQYFSSSGIAMLNPVDKAITPATFKKDKKDMVIVTYKSNLLNQKLLGFIVVDTSDIDNCKAVSFQQNGAMSLMSVQ